MQDNIFQRIMLFLKANFVPKDRFSISLQGLGEPLLDPKLLWRIYILRRWLPQASISINTNGTLLNNTLIRRVGGLLVSLNFSNPESYLRHNGKPLYNQVVSNVERFLKAKGHQPPNTTIQMLNLKENDWQAFREQWQPKLNRNDRLELHSLNQWNQTPTAIALQNRHPCSRLWTQTYFSAEGDVYPCCLGEVANDLKLGNVQSKVNLAKLEQLRLLHKNGLYDQITSCRGCLVWRESSIPMLKIGKKWFG